MYKKVSNSLNIISFLLIKGFEYKNETVKQNANFHTFVTEFTQTT